MAANNSKYYLGYVNKSVEKIDANPKVPTIIFIIFWDVLLNFSFTASEKMCNSYVKTWNIRVSSRVAERLKIFRKYQETF